jgi:hypothetical protein
VEIEHPACLDCVFVFCQCLCLAPASTHFLVVHFAMFGKPLHFSYQATMCCCASAMHACHAIAKFLIACRESFIIVGIPMVASSVSTVATCLPLFATKTVILNRFAAVLAVTMALGLAYVVLFQVPMMGMFGPLVTKNRAPMDASVLKRTFTVLLNSKAVRFMIVCVLALITLVRCSLMR